MMYYITIITLCQPLWWKYVIEFGDDITAVHEVGTGGGVVSGAVIDPLALTGHDYKVWFNQAHYYRDVEGVWKPTAVPDAVGISIRELPHC